MTTLLTSAEAAAHLGVGVSAVKRWADSGALICVRTAGGHRRFTPAALAAFRARQVPAGISDQWTPWLTALTAAPSGQHAVMALLYEARAEGSSWWGVMTLVGELLAAIGERWAQGEITVAEEHLASAALARALASIAETLPVTRAAPQCLLASAEGEEHTLGLALAEVCLREAGWAPRWVGAPTRTTDLIEYVRRREVQMVALSASSHSGDGRALATQASRVGEACRAAGAALVLGGAGRWPDMPPFGVRLDTWEEFAQLTRARTSAP